MCDINEDPMQLNVTLHSCDGKYCHGKPSVVDKEPNSKLDETYPEGGGRAWLSVAGSSCAMICCFGSMNTIGTFQAYIASDQLRAYSASDVGWIFGLYLFLAYSSGIQTGPWFDAQGPKLLLILGTIFLVASTMLLSVCTSWWTFLSRPRYFMLSCPLLC